MKLEKKHFKNLVVLRHHSMDNLDYFAHSQIRGTPSFPDIEKIDGRSQHKSRSPKIIATAGQHVFVDPSAPLPGRSITKQFRRRVTLTDSLFVSTYIGLLMGCNIVYHEGNAEGDAFRNW